MEKKNETNKTTKPKENTNLVLWNKVKKPPKEMLKTIIGGRLTGMSDIKPQWRYQIMTETFGTCGVGWKFEIIKRWIENGSHDQKIAFVDIHLFIKQDKVWSDPIPGNGGSMLVAKESAGLHTSDEAYKMATTDALSTSMKMIGVGADVYMGYWDGSKYKDEPKPEPTTEPKNPSTKTPLQISQEGIRENLKFLKADGIEGFETADKIRKLIKVELKLDKVGDCKDMKMLEAFDNKIAIMAEHHYLKKMMVDMKWDDVTQDLFTFKILNEPVPKCFDKTKLAELRDLILKEGINNNA